MKYFFSFYICCFCSLALPAQWVAQGDKIFGFNHDVSTLRIVDAQTLYAGVNAFPWSSAPTLGPWIVSTRDGGNTWKFRQIPGAAGYVVFGMSIVGKDHIWVALSRRDIRTKHRIYHSSDGGNTWEQQFEGPFAGFGIHFFDLQNGVMIQSARYRHTSDGGKTWSAADSIPMATNLVFFNASENFDTYGDTIWVPSIDGRLAKSVDKGKTWKVLGTPLALTNTSINILNFTNGRHGLAVGKFARVPSADGFYYAINPTRVMRTADGGVTWTQIPESSLPQKPTDAQSWSVAGGIGAVRGTLNTFVMNINYYQSDGLHRELHLSQDGGQTWSLLGERPFWGEAYEFVSPNAGWASDAVFTEGGPYFFRWSGNLLVGSDEIPHREPQNLRLSPNPGTDRMVVRFSEEAIPQGTRILIVDAQGRLKMRLNGVAAPIDVGTLLPGVYTVLVQDGEGRTVGVKQWVKAMEE